MQQNQIGKYECLNFWNPDTDFKQIEKEFNEIIKMIENEYTLLNKDNIYVKKSSITNEQSQENKLISQLINYLEPVRINGKLYNLMNKDRYNYLKIHYQYNQTLEMCKEQLRQENLRLNIRSTLNFKD